MAPPRPDHYGYTSSMSAPPAPARVFLLDEHDAVRRGVRNVLEGSGTARVVGEATTVVAALRAIETLVPDVVILDIRLPDGSGIEVCRQVRSTHPGIKVLFLTSFNDEPVMSSAIMAGAAGYLLKDVRLEGLVEAVGRIVRGESLIDPDLTLALAERADAASRDPRRFGRLTPQERRILLLVADGLTNRQIAQRMALSEGTVKNYVSSILAKLGLERRAQAAVLAANLAREG